MMGSLAAKNVLLSLISSGVFAPVPSDMLGFDAFMEPEEYNTIYLDTFTQPREGENERGAPFDYGRVFGKMPDGDKTYATEFQCGITVDKKYDPSFSQQWVVAPSDDTQDEGLSSFVLYRKNRGVGLVIFPAQDDKNRFILQTWAENGTSVTANCALTSTFAPIDCKETSQQASPFKNSSDMKVVFDLLDQQCRDIIKEVDLVVPERTSEKGAAIVYDYLKVLNASPQ